MKVECVDGEYIVSWAGHPRTGAEAKNWCNEQFGPGWGWAGSSGSAMTLHAFQFKRLYHAQWFVMRWGN
jgi:hypothetical protein